jgi:hypothetical protein
VDKTSNWIVFNTASAVTIPTRPPTPSPTNRATTPPKQSPSVAPAIKKLDRRGRKYCDRKRCGECMGDCDSVRLIGSSLLFCTCQEARSHEITAAACSQDDQCEGNLICFQRGPNESVPGCIGRDSSSKSNHAHRFSTVSFHFSLLTLPHCFINFRH